MTTREEWIAGARPKTLPAAISPVIVGTAFAGYSAQFLNALLALVVALALQVGVNYANDYSDGIKGTDTDRIGPMRLVGSGIASAESVKRAAFIAFGIGSISGLILAARTSWFLIAIGAAALIAAWTYTGGPRPYGYSGLGEVSVFIFFGLVATLGTYYVQVDSLSREVFLASIAMGCLACAILILNNLRDFEKDKKSGKQTLAVKIGESATRNLFRWSLFVPLALSVALSFFSFYYLIALVTLPLAGRLVRSVRSGADGESLIPLLALSGRLQILYALALSLAALLVAR